jgi:hypothetical protein
MTTNARDHRPAAMMVERRVLAWIERTYGWLDREVREVALATWKAALRSERSRQARARSMSKNTKKVTPVGAGRVGA